MARYDKEGHLVVLTVSDPSRQLSHLHLSLSGRLPNLQKYNNVLSLYDSKVNRTSLSIQLSDGSLAGKSFHLDLK